MPKKSKDNWNTHEEGITHEQLDAKLDLILEHVSGTDKKVGTIEKDVKEVKERLEKIEVTLVGKTDVSRTERLEHRVARLEQ